MIWLWVGTVIFEVFVLGIGIWCWSSLSPPTSPTDTDTKKVNQ